MKQMNHYVLMMMDPTVMLENYTVDSSSEHAKIVYRYDFFERSMIRRQLIKSVSRFSVNALLYQLECVVRKSDENWNDNSLIRSLLFLDFQEIFSRKGCVQPVNTAGEYTAAELARNQCPPDIQLRMLFENGFTLNYGDEEITYVPFDKSGSMSRECRISFIDSRLKAEMDKRLLLGLDFTKTQAILSKYYAYRGLYLSDGKRVNSLRLDQETVVILEDESHEVRLKKASNEPMNIQVFGCKDPLQPLSASESLPLLSFESYKKESIKITPFDGEGLISPVYADIINHEIGLTANGKAASSFQIRMPFAKGMLHTVDFQRFFREFGEAGDSPLLITDIFGIQRDLRKAQIILTKSMFKCADWLEDILQDAPEIEDFIAEYFNRFRQYDHALYISNTDCGLSNSGITILNYQFLNTLAFQPEEFQELVSRHIDRIPNISASLLEKNLNLDTESEKSVDIQRDDCEDNSNLSKHKEPWIQALQINPNFLRNVKVKDWIANKAIELQKNTALGRLTVAGECRFLSCDLLSMLFGILQKTDSLSDTQKKKIQGHRKQSSLYADHFYLPSPNIQLNHNQKCGFLRNPHLSRNEQSVLRSYQFSNSLYEQYFGHLSGIVMISRNTLVPMALGGADFDGDMVRVVSEPAVVDAILRGSYVEDRAVGKNGHNRNREMRKLPLVEIPSTKKLCKAQHVPDKVSYDTVRNTFSNSIGRISNLAIRLGEREYLQGEGSVSSKCAECTIVTGLEIDAAKTGAHPSRNIESLADASKLSAGGTSDFIDFKNQLKELPRYGLQVNEKKTKDQSTEYTVTYGKPKQTLTIRKHSEDDTLVSNLERLPYCYILSFDAVRESEQKRKKLLPDDSILYTFQDEKRQWIKQLDADLRDQTKTVMCAYAKVQRKIRDLHQCRQMLGKSNCFGRIYTLLKIQYDSLEMLLPNTECSVMSAVDSFANMLFEQFTAAEALKSALDRLAACSWQFTPQALREARLREILFGDAAEEKHALIPKEICALLCNFSCDGYMLLYYFLEDAISKEFREISAAEYQAYMDFCEQDAEESPDSSFFTELYQKYLKMDSDKNDDYQSCIVDLCQAELFRIFDGDWDTAMRYVFSLRNQADKSEKFFWSVLPAEVILRNVRRADTNQEGGAEIC